MTRDCDCTVSAHVALSGRAVAWLSAWCAVIRGISIEVWCPDPTSKEEEGLVGSGNETIFIVHAQFYVK